MRECTLTNDMCSPYTRETYRYTPLLAVLLAPNEWVHPSFGKYLFAACDLVAGVLLYRLLVDHILPSRTHRSARPPNAASAEDKKPTFKQLDQATLKRHATLLTALHLLNPMVFTISTRGSSESVLLLLVLAALATAFCGRWNAAAVLIGLSTHWKIYPLVYGAACVGVIGGQQGKTGWRRYVNLQAVQFGAVAAGTFAALGAAMYAMYASQPLRERPELDTAFIVGDTPSSTNPTFTTSTDGTTATISRSTSI